MHMLRALTVAAVISAIAAPAMAGTRLKSFVRKTTKTPTSRVMARPSGSGHWSTAHPTTSTTRGSKVVRKR